jgi:hypothetical protein
VRHTLLGHLPNPLDPHGAFGWLSQASELVRGVLRWAAHHTGLPIMLVAAIALVASGHVVKRTLRWGLEVTVVLGLLFAATRLGWIAW